MVQNLEEGEDQKEYIKTLTMPDMTIKESICVNQQGILGQASIAVLVLTVIRNLVPRVQSIGRKSAMEKQQAKAKAEAAPTAE